MRTVEESAEVITMLELCSDSPSGLRWAAHARYNIAGKPAGQAHDYWRITYRNKRFLAHRLIWMMLHGEIPDGLVIDHEDGDGLNNAHDNLRIGTQAQNTYNRGAKKGRDLPKGIYKHRTRPGYMARFKYRGKEHARYGVDLPSLIEWLSQSRARLHKEFAHD